MGKGNQLQGAHVWVKHNQLAWAKGHVTKVGTGSSKVTIKLEKGGNVTVDDCDVELCTTTPEQECAVQDLTLLSDLHHPALLSSLNERFKKDQIYTYTGPILIAINPFKNLAKIFDSKNKKMYLSAAGPGTRSQLAPHAWNLAHNAYQAMCSGDGRNQSILVSGESGAGKTVSTKIVMDYLSIVASSNPIAKLNKKASLKRRSSSQAVSQRMMEANPLMEAFGNAKTLRNDNSSRFGKLIQLQFDETKFSLVGAFINIYLLEKSRVIGQLDGERNYHIFYELDKGLSSKEKKKIEYPSLKASRYTGQSGCFTRSDIKDEDQFKGTVAAFSTLGFSEQDKNSIFQLVSAVLHLGNIDFEPQATEEQGCKVTKDSKASLQTCARLLDVPVDMLETTLTCRSISVGGGGVMNTLAKFANSDSGAITKKHTAAQCAEMRDGLAQTLYNQVFSWLVWRINESTTDKASRSAVRAKSTKLNGGIGSGGSNKANHRDFYDDFSIGCLDIFGFEVFERNGFEQLLINYTNETLQNQFNDFVFHLERAEYEREGINWSVIDFPDNAACLKMIEGRPMGLLKLVDEECLYPSGTDKSLAQKLYSNLGREENSSFFAGRELRLNHQFGVAHFAGNVVYTVDQFCRKNKNELRQEAVDLLRSSKVPLFKMLLPPDAAAAGGGSDPMAYFTKQSNKQTTYRSSLERHAAPSRAASRLQSQTVSASFTSQLRVAMEHIRHSEPHYIRCIKSNDLNRKDTFDRLRVEEQLCYSGVLEVVKVARAGYGTRFELEEFCSKYALLARKRGGGSKRRSWGFGKSSDSLASAKVILGNSALESPEDFQIGKTKVFLKAKSYNRLEFLRTTALKRYVIVIQRAVRAWLARWKSSRKLREKAAKQRRANEEKLRKEKEAQEAIAREAERKRRSNERREAEKRRLQEEEEREARAEAKRLKEEREQEAREAKAREAERKRLSKERRQAEEKLRKEEEKLAKERKKQLELEEKAAKAQRVREAREARLAERERQKAAKKLQMEEASRKAQEEREARDAEEAERRRLARIQEEAEAARAREENERLRAEANKARDAMRSQRLEREKHLRMLKEQNAALQQQQHEKAVQEERAREARSARVAERERQKQERLRQKEEDERLEQQLREEEETERLRLAIIEENKQAEKNKEETDRLLREGSKAKDRLKSVRLERKQSLMALREQSRAKKKELAEQSRLKLEAEQEQARVVKEAERKRLSELRRAEESKKEIKRQQQAAAAAKKLQEKQARIDKARLAREEHQAKQREKELLRVEREAKNAEEKRKRLSKMRKEAERKERERQAENARLDELRQEMLKQEQMRLEAQREEDARIEAEIAQLEAQRQEDLARAEAAREELKRQEAAAKEARKQREEQARIDRERRAQQLKDASRMEKERKRKEKEAKAAQEERRRLSNMRRIAEQKLKDEDALAIEQLELEARIEEERMKEELERQAIEAERREQDRIEQEKLELEFARQQEERDARLEAELAELKSKRQQDLARAEEARLELMRQEAKSKQSKQRRENEIRLEKERRAREAQEAKAREQERKRVVKEVAAAEKERKRLSKLRRAAGQKFKQEEEKALAEMEQAARLEEQRLNEELERQDMEEELREKELLEQEHQEVLRAQQENDEELEAELQRLEAKRLADLARAEEARREIDRQARATKQAKQRRDYQAKLERERKLRLANEAKERDQERKRKEKQVQAAEKECKRLSKLRRAAEKKSKAEEARAIQELELKAKQDQQRIKDDLERQVEEEEQRASELLEEEQTWRERFAEQQQEEEAQMAREERARDEEERLMLESLKLEETITTLRARNQRIRGVVDDQKRWAITESALGPPPPSPRSRSGRRRTPQRVRNQGARESIPRQRAAGVLQGLARMIKDRKTTRSNRSDLANQMADSAAIALRKTARTLAPRKTQEMLDEEEAENELARIEAADKHLVFTAALCGALLLVVWYPPLLGVVLLGALILVPTIESRERRLAAKNPNMTPLAGSSYSLRSYGAQSARSSRSTRTSGRSGSSRYPKSARSIQRRTMKEERMDYDLYDDANDHFMDSDSDEFDDDDLDAYEVSSQRSRKSIFGGAGTGRPSSGKKSSRLPFKIKGLLTKKNSFALSDGSESITSSASSPRRGGAKRGGLRT